MSTPSQLFKMEQQHDRLIVTPLRNLGEFVMDEFPDEAEKVLAAYDRNPVPRVLIDLQHTDYLQSTALGFLVALHQKVTDHQGKLVCCSGSPFVRDILASTKLDRLFPVYDSRENALKALENPS